MQSCTDMNSSRAPDRMLGEVRGHSSRCMASSLVRTGFVRGSMTHGNGCYQHRCINNSLEVVVDGVWKVCPAAATSFTFPSTNPRSKHNLSQQYRVWNRRTFQPSGLFAARVGLQGSTPGLHALFTGEDDTWEAWLNIDASGFSNVISLGRSGIMLRSA